jgi:hypothetical protein
VSIQGVIPKDGLRVFAGPAASEIVVVYVTAVVGAPAADHGVLSSVAVPKRAPFESGFATPVPPAVPPTPARNAGKDR